MKKKITLLSALMLGIGVGYGQISQNLGLPAKQAVKTLRTDLSSIQSKTIVSSNSAEKASGDTAWVDYFENASSWTATGTSADYNTNGWSIVSSINSWAFNPGSMGTTGQFAHFTNGDPNNAPTVLPGPFTLDYNTVIDLTGKVAPFIEFEQYGAHFVTVQEVQISVDNGLTWVAVASNSDIPPLTGAGGSPYAKPMTRRFPISNAIAADPGNVKLRLFWDGAMNGPDMNYVDYGWFVDNIRVMEGYTDDLTMQYTLSFTGPQALQYTKFPASQANGAVTRFVASVNNVGVNAQDALLHVDEPINAYSGVSSASTSIAAGSKDTISVNTASGFTIPSTAGIYDFTYYVTSSNNTLQLTNDDTLTAPFEVTDSIYATDGYDGTPASMTGGFTSWTTSSGDPAIGTLFEMFNAGSFQHVQVGIANIQASGQADYIGNLYYASVYKYDGSQFNVIATSQDAILTANDFGKLVDMPFTTPVTVVPGDLIMVVAGSYIGSEVPIAFAGTNIAGQTVGIDGANTVSLIASSNDSNSVEAPVVRINFGNYNIVKITPQDTQVVELAYSSLGSLISVSELPNAADSREWKYATTSGGPYTSFATPQTSFSYTPNYADFGALGTYFLVCESTYGTDILPSNEVVLIFEDHTGISENSTPKFAVYSVENGMKVDLSSTTLKDATIRVVSMDGKVVAKSSLTSNTMNTVDVNVPTGIYFYTINNDTKVFKGKVFIK